MRLLPSWTPLTRIATRTQRWSCNFCVTTWPCGPRTQPLMTLRPEMLPLPPNKTIPPSTPTTPLTTTTRCPYAAAAFPCRKTSSVPPIFSKCCPNLISIKIIIFSFLSPKTFKNLQDQNLLSFRWTLFIYCFTYKAKIGLYGLFSTIPSFFKKTADFFSLWRLFIRSKKRKQHFFDLKKYFFLFICFFQSLKICECLNTK